MRLPRNRPGAGQHPGGSLLPHALHQRIGAGAFVPLTGSMDRKAPLYTGNFTDGFCPVPRPSPAGIFSRGEGQSRPVQHRAFARTPALARRGILTGRGPAPPGSAAGESALVIGSPADGGNDLLAAFYLMDQASSRSDSEHTAIYISVCISGFAKFS